MSRAFTTRANRSFLAQPGRYLDREAKLRLWQSLAYEVSHPLRPELTQLGLAYFDTPLPSLDLPDLPTSSTPPSPSTPKATRTPLPPTATFTPVPMPQSLNKVNTLLHAHGHVNLQDYFHERSLDRLHGDTHKGTYAHLVYPTASAMRRYTLKNRKFVPLDTAKSEALQPLLRSFRFRGD